VREQGITKPNTKRNMLKPKVGSVWKISKQHVVIKAVLDETICFIRLSIDENKKLVATPDPKVIKGTVVQKMKWSALETRMMYVSSSINKAEQKLREKEK
jgi:hypothetical protein